MKYSELKKAIEEWGEKYHYKPVIKAGCQYIEIVLEGNGYVSRICVISKSERFVLDLIWPAHRDLSENAKNDLFKIVTKLAGTDPKDREDEKRFIIPLLGLVTTDGKQQYLSHKGNFFASRRDEELRQTWKEEHLKFVPEVYRQFAEEFDEDREY